MVGQGVSDRGSAVLLVAVALVFAGLLSLGAAALGEAMLHRQQAQTAADAAALARTYAAIADPVRLRLLSLITAAGEVCSCDLVAPLAKSQPTVSHHTKILAEAGLISGEKRGRWVHWSIEPSRTEFVQSILNH